MASSVPRRLVYSKTAPLAYTDTTAIKLFTLPRGAIPLRVTVFTEEASASATCDVGVYGDTDSLIEGLDVSSLGSNLGTLLDNDEREVPTDIYGRIANPTAGGDFVVTLEYSSVRTTRVV